MPGVASMSWSAVAGFLGDNAATLLVGGSALVVAAVHVPVRGTALRDVPGWTDETIKMSYLVRDGQTRVLARTGRRG